MKKHFTCSAALVASLLCAAPVLAQTTAAPVAPMAPMAHSAMSPASGAAMAPAGTANLSVADKTFVMKAAKGGMAEVQLAKLAQQKGQSDAVKTFAQGMIDDHTPANDKLAKLASTKGLTAPADIDPMDQKMMTKLQGMDGKKFDTAYLKGQVKAHKAMLKTFEMESKDGTDPDLKAFADATIPTIQKHITMAQSGKSGTM